MMMLATRIKLYVIFFLKILRKYKKICCVIKFHITLSENDIISMIITAEPGISV